MRAGAVHVLVHANGDLRALRSVQLMVPPMGGQVTIIELVANGTAVKAGDIIVEFDASEQEFALEQATFDLQLADQEIVKAEAEAAVQAADDEVALLKARFEVRRAELDASTNELVGAVLAAQHKLLLDEARDRLAQLEVDVKSRRDSVDRIARGAARAAHEGAGGGEVARRNIDNLQIRAPFDGFVTVRMNMMAFGGVVFSGAVMPEYRVGDTANPGQLVAELIDTSRVEITAKLPEHDRANVRRARASGSPWTPCPAPTSRARFVRSSGVASRQMFERRHAPVRHRLRRRRRHVAYPAGRQRRARHRRARRSTTRCTCRERRCSTWRASATVYVRTPAGFEPREVKVVRLDRDASPSSKASSRTPKWRSSTRTPPGARQVAGPAGRGRAVKRARAACGLPESAAAASTTCCCTSCARS